MPHRPEEGKSRGKVKEASPTIHHALGERRPKLRPRALNTTMMLRCRALMLVLFIAGAARGFRQPRQLARVSRAGAPARARCGRRAAGALHMIDPLLPAQVLFCAGMIGAGTSLTFDEAEPEPAPQDGDAFFAPPEGVAAAAEAGGSSQEIDIFRDSPLRYLGYSNECGEAFRPLVPLPVVLGSYGLAIAYVVADAIAKAFDASGEGGSAAKAVAAATDVLAFQMLASVACPGFTINRWVALVDFWVREACSAPQLQGSVNADVVESLVHWVPTAAGLLLIPFIVKPLDTLVEKMLDMFLRPLLDEVTAASDP